MGTRIVLSVLGVALLLGVGCDDPAKDRKIEALERQMAELEGMVADLEQQAEQIKADADRPAGGGDRCAAALAACRQRLVECEQDPFKGGKYFEAAGDTPTKAAGKTGELVDPFKGGKAERPPAGEVKDPFAKTD